MRRLSITVSVLLPFLITVHAESSAPKSGSPSAGSRRILCGTSPERQRDARVRARYRDSLQQIRPRGPSLLIDRPRALQADAGDVAVIEDDGTLVTEPNTFDLKGRAVRFVPVDASKYRVEVRTSPFAAGAADTRLTLSDDDSALVSLSPAFDYFGKSYSSVHVNSDGNLTFDESDVASTARDLGRFAWGPPRIGPFFSDLDPGAATVFYRRDIDGTVFVWEDVPGYGTSLFNTFSVKLFDDGAVEFAYSPVMNVPDAIVGISPGGASAAIHAADFSAGLPAETLAGAIAEVFAAEGQLSETAIARMFYRNHPDEFDQLVVFLAFPFDIPGAFAYELNVGNDVLGIGLPAEDDSRAYGSGGRLKSFVMMGDLEEFPEDPEREFLRTYNSLQAITHEVAHRWLAFPLLQEESGPTISLLHSGDRAHWSFFFNADASLMEGNRIIDRGAALGDQRFMTAEVTDRLSALDLYLMGFKRAEEVPGMFYVGNPSGTSRTSDSVPSHVSTVFGGARRDFTVDDVISANGPRVPSSYRAPRVHRIAFVLVSRPGDSVAAQTAKLQSLHDAWVPYFNRLTEGQAWAVTSLQSSPATSPSRILFPSFEGDSGSYTGFALANWGTVPVDVLFRFFDDSGREATSPSNIINPRIVTIPPGGQIARLGEQIHGLAFTDARRGWVQAESTGSEVTGFFIEADLQETFMDGAVADGRTAARLWFTRAQADAAGLVQDHLAVVNPNDAEAHVSLKLIDAAGTQRGDAAARVLPPRGRLSENLQALFPGAGPGFSGYVALESDLGVVGYQSRRGAQSVFSLPAQPQSGARELFSAQFASGPVGGIRYFTELNLINTAAAPRLAQISLIGEDGIRIAGPVTYALNAGEAKLVRGETVFGLQNPALATVLTEGTLEVRADGDGILGDVTFGDAAAGRFISALPLDGAPLADMILSQVAEGSQDAGRAYFTGIAMYNPNASDVDVAVNVFSEDGVPTGAGSLVLRSGRRIAQTLSELVPGFPGQMRGYVRITASGGPVIAYEVFGNASADFLAAVPPQGIAR